MNQTELVHYALSVLEGQQIPYMIVGSYASGIHGEPRLTLDIDIVVDLKAEQVESLCAAFPSGEFYVSLEAARDAVRRRKQFNVIHPASGNKIDFMVARHDAWGQSQLDRRVERLVLPDRTGFTASAEDIIISKMRYFREGESDKHLRDCAGILLTSREKINREYIEYWVKQFELKDVWEAVLLRVEQQQSKEC